MSIASAVGGIQGTNNNNMIFYFGVHLMCCYCQFLFTVISLALAVHSNSRHVSCGSHYNAAYHYGELVNNISITVFLQKHTTLYSNTHNEHLLPSRARSTMGNQGNLNVKRHNINPTKVDRDRLHPEPPCPPCPPAL